MLISIFSLNLLKFLRLLLIFKILNNVILLFSNKDDINTVLESYIDNKNTTENSVYYGRNKISLKYQYLKYTHFEYFFYHPLTIFSQILCQQGIRR